MNSRYRAAYFGLAVLALVWGYNWVVMKIALRYAPPFTFAALRAIGAAVALFGLLLIMRKKILPPSPGRVALLSLFQTVGFFLLVNMALYLGHAGKTVILAYTMPFWVLFLAVPLLHESLTRMKLSAACLGFAGLILILQPWTRPPDLLGTLLATAAGLDWAIAVVIAKKIPVDSTWELVSINAWAVALGAIPLLVVAFLVHGHPVHWTGVFIVAFTYTVLLGTGLAWLLWLFILQRLPAGSSGLSALVIPVVGILSAWLQLGERPGTWELAGIVVVLSALATLALTEFRASRS